MIARGGGVGVVIAPANAITGATGVVSRVAGEEGTGEAIGDRSRSRPGQGPGVGAEVGVEARQEKQQGGQQTQEKKKTSP